MFGKNNSNVIVAIALSFLVLLGWQYFVAGPKIQSERQRQAAEQAKTADAAPGTVTGTQAGGTAPTGAPAASGVPAGSSPSGATAADTAPTLTREAALGNGQRVAIDTPSLKGSINLQGGRLDDLLLAKYHVTVDDSSPLVELFSPAGTQHPYFAEFGWVPGDATVATPKPDTLWQAQGGPLAPGQDVTLSWDNGTGLTFRRVYTVDQDYMFTVRQTVENHGAGAVTLHPYGLVSRTGKPDAKGYYILHEGAIGYLGTDGLQEIKYKALDKQLSVTPAATSSGWLGITDKYWAAALVPKDQASFQPRFMRAGSDAMPTYQADFLGSPVAVAAGATASSETLLFAGAKEVHLVDSYETTRAVPRFELLIDWGWFYFITKPMFKFIDFMYHLLGNFGLAILAVTVVVKAIFFPLANRSYASMSKMKKVQPEIQAMQARFKDDKMGLQKAMMELYKKEKINPVAGCWPIVIQIPVFFSLYKVLFVTIEMRHAPFFGWIRDLSAPDPTSVFNLFGLIPWELPPSLHLGIWPLIMGFTMFLQMRMNPTPPDKTQAMIFNWMPLIFTFMLGSFPAGLVIYWAWNNTLSVLQQGLIMKRNGVPIELFGNLRGLVSRGKPKDSPAE